MRGIGRPKNPPSASQARWASVKNELEGVTKTHMLVDPDATPDNLKDHQLPGARLALEVDNSTKVHNAEEMVAAIAHIATHSQEGETHLIQCCTEGTRDKAVFGKDGDKALEAVQLDNLDFSDLKDKKGTFVINMAGCCLGATGALIDGLNMATPENFFWFGFKGLTTNLLAHSDTSDSITDAMMEGNNPDEDEHGEALFLKSLPAAVGGTTKGHSIYPADEELQSFWEGSFFFKASTKSLDQLLAMHQGTLERLKTKTKDRMVRLAQGFADIAGIGWDKDEDLQAMADFIYQASQADGLKGTSLAADTLPYFDATVVEAIEAFQAGGHAWKKDEVGVAGGRQAILNGMCSMKTTRMPIAGTNCMKFQPEEGGSEFMLAALGLASNKYRAGAGTCRVHKHGLVSILEATGQVVIGDTVYDCSSATDFMEIWKWVHGK